ncbi:MAG: beta-N-acetylhexosaminidase [Chitinophagaceae bacterium]|nr:beta-N-acetylhexosaminidase [Chitinophagaceae bacterium]MCA6453290.1 beta-N-acetylhexosaminidase [Chitinophagaceae bacterium]MCA6454936.1 beta-N-acetylhexosaminidase [Chitinophagaceae bacterium]MCA6458485.1 beta-N-acetylhexosaminidase [Chitinophagaceae bacterium]MCA6465099.1 beta-N-acetylhexosaminidase [Chitinophagaceae bacterium]
MKKRLLCFSLLLAVMVSAQEPAIIPKPSRMEMQDGNFNITPSTQIVLKGPGLEKAAMFLNDYLQKFYGFKLAVTKAAVSRNSISLGLEKMESAIAGAYHLQVNRTGVQIKGDGAIGTFYGVQSLVQLLPVEKKKELTVPALEIEDQPRFAYRGMHLDVGRHFYPIDFIKKFIDYIALHKMNTFHWHLTEDQGWRIEIKKYPKLTQVGAFRNGTIIGHHPGTGNDQTKYGGYYTQEQVKEIVKYASDRFITVIPEIEMPGHASAAIAAYPELSCFPDEATKHPAKVSWYGDSTGKQVQQAWGVYPDVFAPTEYTFKFLENVLDEVMALFPSTYIHIGGDECPKENWKRSAFCQQLIKEKGLKDEHDLQSYFIQRIEKYLNSKGRQIIGWDEILEGGLAPNATVMSWRGEKGGIEAAKQKHNVIMTPNSYVYFDYAQNKQEDSLVIGGYLTVQKVYNYEPVPGALAAEDTKYILGAQANVWSEYMKTPAKVEYMVFPRMSALSEVLWSRKESRNWSDFEKRMEKQTKRYELWNASYNKKYLDPANK